MQIDASPTVGRGKRPRPGLVAIVQHEFTFRSDDHDNLRELVTPFRYRDLPDNSIHQPDSEHADKETTIQPTAIPPKDLPASRTTRLTAAPTAPSSTRLPADTTQRTPHTHVARSDQGPAASVHRRDSALSRRGRRSPYPVAHAPPRAACPFPESRAVNSGRPRHLSPSTHRSALMQVSTSIATRSSKLAMRARFPSPAPELKRLARTLSAPSNTALREPSTPRPIRAQVSAPAFRQGSFSLVSALGSTAKCTRARRAKSNSRGSRSRRYCSAVLHTVPHHVQRATSVDLPAEALGELALGGVRAPPSNSTSRSHRSIWVSPKNVNSSAVSSPNSRR